MNRLNFSWVLPNRLAGCAGPEDEDDLLFLRREGVDLLVRLAGNDQAMVTSQQVAGAGLKDLHVPVPDHSAPSQRQLDMVVGAVKEALQRGDSVAVSCFAGIGRSGTVLTCVLVSLCYSVDEAVREVCRTRHWAWETADQHQAIITFAKRMGKS